LVQVGLGSLGRQIVRFAAERNSLRLVAAVDPAPQILGQDVGELCGLKPLRVRAAKDLESALGRRKADVAVVATVSDIDGIEPQIRELARAGLDIVSTCEELSFAWETAPTAARRIDAVCRKHGVTCLATGVNPGFLMDFFPLVLTGICQRVDAVHVRRVQDASRRRLSFQEKIGAGLNLVEFRQKAAQGRLRHVGLTESMDMIAHRIGWKLSRTTETLEPVVADNPIRTEQLEVAAGCVRGVEQVARAYVGDRLVITLEFRAAIGEPEPLDSVEVTGEPTFRAVIPGGVNGDVATCAIVLNAIRDVVAAPAGLKTMVDLPAVAYPAR
jgi:4-hydroxy-tetrahydrodipicolinate reductase